jgi:hypothetical protein
MNLNHSGFGRDRILRSPISSFLRASHVGQVSDLPVFEASGLVSDFQPRMNANLRK